MRKRILEVLKTNTIRQSAITSISTFLSAGVGAVFYLVLARKLGTNEYGLVSISLAILTLVATVCDVGMGPGLIRFVGKYRGGKSYLPYASLALRTKLITGTSSWLVLWLAAEPLSKHIFHQPQLQYLLPIIGFGVLCYLLASFSISLSQALERYMLWGGLQIGSNSFRLMVLLLLFLTSGVNSQTTLIVFSIACLSGFIVSFRWLDTEVFSARPSSLQIKEFWSFNVWTGAFSVITSIVSRLDVLLAGRFLALSSVGVYSLAVLMAAFLPQISAALGTVTAPKFAGFGDSLHATSYLRKASLFSTLIGICVSILMVPVAALVIYFTGQDYTSAFVPFLILLLSLIVFMAGNPIRDSILYFYHRPQFFVWSGLGQGIVLVTLGTLIVPVFGISGLAVSVLGQHVFLAVLCLLYYKLLSKVPRIEKNT